MLLILINLIKLIPFAIIKDFLLLFFGSLNDVSILILTIPLQ